MSAALSTRPLHPYGMLSGLMKDHIYHIPGRGQIFTSPWITADVTMQFFAVISLTACGASFEVRIAGQTGNYDALAIRPSTQRRFVARNLHFVSFTLDPRDPCFRLFRAIPEPGFLTLDRNAFAPFNAALEAAYNGELSIAEATHLYANVVDTVSRFLPKRKPIDERARQAMELLRLHPHLTLEELADVVGLSYDRMSHFFSESVGLPLRSYQLWRKLHTVTCLLVTGRNLTACAHAAGFTDSAHLSRTFLQVYGAPPSYFLDKSKVTHFTDHGTDPRQSALHRLVPAHLPVARPNTYASAIG